MGVSQINGLAADGYTGHQVTVFDEGGGVYSFAVHLAGGTVIVTPGVVTSASPNDPVQSALINSAVQALPANSARLWVIVQNFGSDVLYYLFGSVAQTGAISSTNCSGFIAPGAAPLVLCGSQIITSVIQWCSTASGTTGNIQDGEA